MRGVTWDDTSTESAPAPTTSRLEETRGRVGGGWGKWRGLLFEMAEEQLREQQERRSVFVCVCVSE